MARLSQLTRAAAIAILVSAFGATVSQAQILYSDTFATDTSANYNVFQTTGASGNTANVTFAFNYSSLGVPAAPIVNGIGNGTSQVGLRVQSDELQSTTSDLIGAVSVVAKNVTLPAAYKLQVAVWGNYIGGTTINDAAGSNGTTGPTVATGVKGATYSSATTNGAASEGGFLADQIRDPTGSGGTYRVYIGGVNQGNSNGAFHVYAASGGSDAATTAQMFSNAYYASTFPAVSAPTAQSSAATTQTGTTPVGTFGFAWHVVTVQDDGTNTTWSIDNLLIATIPDTDYTRGGSTIALGDQDSNTGASTAANGPTYNFDLFSNLVVTTLAVPEPGSLSLVTMAGVAFLVRRRRTAKK
jgi:hypothetical protein